MMVLCPNHHDEATKGALSEPEQRALKAEPFNRVNGYASGMLKASTVHCAVRAGSVELVNDGAMLEVDGECLLGLSVEDGSVLISVTVYDDSGKLLLLIRDNEWITGDPLAWDLEADFQKLTVRQKYRDVRLRLNFQETPIDLRARLTKNAFTVEISRDRILLAGEEAAGVTFKDLCFVGAIIAANSETRSVQVRPDPRYGSFILVSEPSPLLRVMKGLKQLARLQTP
jgi:hypothetical protein